MNSTHPNHYHLYHYWRSSSSWRVRIALEWKNLSYDTTHVGLLNGESESAEHLKRNPAGFVPVLELKTGTHAGEFLTESLSIIRFLEETHPESPTLFPGTALDHARIWALAETINSGTHPLQNIPVMAKHSDDPEEQKRWSQHWVRHGLEIFEQLSSRGAGKFSHGDHFSLADLCLIPQLYNAERYSVDISDLPSILRAKASCHQIPALLESHPDCFKPPEFQ